MELDTYRYSGHSMSDPGKRWNTASLSINRNLLLILLHFDSYRPADEVKLAIEERDPIKIARSYAIDGQLANIDELEVSKLSLVTRTIHH